MKSAARFCVRIAECPESVQKISTKIKVSHSCVDMFRMGVLERGAEMEISPIAGIRAMPVVKRRLPIQS